MRICSECYLVQSIDRLHLESSNLISRLMQTVALLLRTQKTSQMPHHREEKKERVKQCIRELNALMPEGSQRKGLLGTLQQVVQRMKQIKGNALLPSC